MSVILSLRDLRQNPTQAIDAVEAGAVVTITRQNRPIADLVPHRAAHGTSPSSLAAALRETPVDSDWAAQLAESRRLPVRDVWGDGQ
ncbi:MAG: type II toxin-antitoxin system prevent-host-death family antitoxin [Micrococcales bacterium]|nr:type II toxin-antitoxin system prevent-host-death family antitoxin [Micrococcales bacterium]